MFQVLGYAAFLLPMGILALGVRWFRSQPLDSAVGSLIGYALLMLSLPALLSLWRDSQCARGDSAGRLRWAA